MVTKRTMSELYNKHAGCACYIVGSGPSLHFQDLNPLKEYVTIAVNAGLVKIPFCDYFISDDWDVSNWSYYAVDLPKLNCTALLFKDKIGKYTKHLRKDQYILFGHKEWCIKAGCKYNMDGLILTKDPDKPIIGARTSSGSAIHMAYIMGCDPIILLGHDCCYIENKRYFWQFHGENKPYRTDYKITPSCPNSGKINGARVDVHARQFLAYFEMLSKQTKSQNIRVINASPGILDSFERMNYCKSLCEFKNKKKK